MLWKISLLSFEKMGFPLAGGLDPASGEITSGWKTNLQPFSGQGYRTRAELHMTPLGSGRWDVKSRVQKQTNQAIVAPLDLARAEWEWAPEDPVLAAILLHRIKSLLAPELELSEPEDDDDPLRGSLDQHP